MGGSDQGAREALQKEAKSAQAAAKKTTSAILQVRTAREARKAEKEAERVKEKLKNEKRLLQKDQQKAQDVKKKLFEKIKLSVHKVLAAKPSKGTRLDREKKREVRSAAKKEVKDAMIVAKDGARAARSEAKANRIEEKTEKVAKQLADMKKQKKDMTTRIVQLANSTSDNAAKEKVKLEASVQQLGEGIKAKESQKEKDKQK